MVVKSYESKSTVDRLKELEKICFESCNENCGERKCVDDMDIKEGYNRGITEYSDKLFKAIERATINCKLDITIEDLRNIEIIIKGLAEEMKDR